jgi:hypothetical protein
MNAFTKSEVEVFSLGELKQLGFTSLRGSMHSAFRAGPGSSDNREWFLSG